MKPPKHNKIKMATRVSGGKKNKDKQYDEFFLDETDAVKSGAKNPDTQESLIKRKNYDLHSR